MQFVSLILSLVLLAQFTIFRLPANADTITYNPKASDSQATVEGKVSVNKVGNLLMKDAYAFMHGNQVEIVGKSAGSNTSGGLLSGSVIAPKVHTSGGTASFTGTAFFASGTAMGVINNPSVTETVATVSGGSVTGHIASVSASGVTVELASGAEKVVALTDISAIASPRAYTFKITGSSTSKVDPLKTFSVNAKTIVFAPTTTSMAATVKSDDHHMSKRKKMVLWVVSLLLIATAIAVPIAVAVPLANSHSGTNSASSNSLVQLAYYTFLKQRQAKPNFSTIGGFSHIGGCI